MGPEMGLQPTRAPHIRIVQIGFNQPNGFCIRVLHAPSGQSGFDFANLANTSCEISSAFLGTLRAIKLEISARNVRMRCCSCDTVSINAPFRATPRRTLRCADYCTSAKKKIAVTDFRTLTLLFQWCVQTKAREGTGFVPKCL